VLVWTFRNFRRSFRVGMIRSRYAKRITHPIYPLRNIDFSSYVLALLITSVVTLLSYFFRSSATGGTISSYYRFLLESLLSVMISCCVFQVGPTKEHARNDDESSQICDHVEDLGGNGAKVAAYLRVSTGRQAKEGYSLSVQKEQLDRLKEELKPSRIHWFVDAGKSAVDFDRRKTTSIMQLAKEEKIQELWVIQINRMGRLCVELVAFFFDLCKKGVLIRTPEKVYSLKDLSSVLSFVIEAHAAEEENKRRAKSAVASKVRRFRSKIWNKVAIPLGYEKKGGWLERKLTLEPLIEEAYDFFLRVQNLESMTKYLDTKYRPLLRRPLSRYQVRSILSDPIYVGKPRHLGEVVQDPCLAYVDEQKSGEVQEILKRIHNRHRPKRADPLMDLVAHCGISVLEFFDIFEHRHRGCGGLMVRNGTRVAKGLIRQIFLCKSCKHQWVVPNNTQLEKILQHYSRGSSLRSQPQPPDRSIYPLAYDQCHLLGKSSKRPDHLGTEQVTNGTRSNRLDRRTCDESLDKFLGQEAAVGVRL